MSLRCGRASFFRSFVLISAVLLVGGCDLLGQADLIRNMRREPNGPEVASPITEQALGKLAKGELIAAHNLFDQALKANPADVYALMGKGLILQRWNEPSQAKAAYEAVLALRPDPNVKMVVWGSPDPQSVSELASVNLGVLQASTADGVPAPSPMVTPGGAQMQASPAATIRPPGAVRPSAAQPFLPEADANIAARFEVLSKLRDQGLVTPDEYAERRKANLGALLPMSVSNPPAAGLERSVPSAEQIVGRLNAINRALEMRAINMRQHSAERTTIIDGLLPAQPRTTVNPPMPPKGLIEAADNVRKLEAFKERGVITNDEYNKEKEAVERALAPPPAPRAAAAAPAAASAPAAAPLAGGPRPAVHIASYRSEDAANKGWTQLRRAHPAQLGSLQPDVSRVNLGAGKGVFYRLLAGPLASQAAADRICRELKAKRQFCETSFMSLSSAAAPRGNG